MSVSESDDQTGTVATLADQVFDRLQNDILSGRFAPGTKLLQKDLGDAYGTSGSAVREALTQLASVGLVAAEPQRGFRVAQASIADLVDLTKSRCWVEAIALRSAMAKGGRDWEAAIIAAAHMLGDEQPRRKVKTSPSDAFANVDGRWRIDHQDYHDALIAACDLPSLLSYRRNLIQLNERYRRLSSLVQTDRDVANEHDRLTRAVLDRNADLAVDVIETHFLETTARVLAGTSAFDGSIADAIGALRADIRAGDGRATPRGVRKAKTEQPVVASRPRSRRA
jgi:GntR family carbon starvation induced transcriptional regulator